MTTNLSAFDNLVNPAGVATAANTASDGYLFGLILLALFVIIFIVFKQYDTKAVIVGDAFICTVIAALMWAGEWISFKILIWPLLILFGGIIALLFWPD